MLSSTCMMCLWVWRPKVDVGNLHLSVCSRLPQSNLEFTDECILLADLDFLSLVSRARITGELPYLPGIYQNARERSEL